MFLHSLWHWVLSIAFFVGTLTKRQVGRDTFKPFILVGIKKMCKKCGPPKRKSFFESRYPFFFLFALQYIPLGTDCSSRDFQGPLNSSHQVLIFWVGTYSSQGRGTRVVFLPKPWWVFFVSPSLRLKRGYRPLRGHISYLRVFSIAQAICFEEIFQNLLDWSRSSYPSDIAPQCNVHLVHLVHKKTRQMSVLYKIQQLFWKLKKAWCLSSKQLLLKVSSWQNQRG